MKSEFYNLLDTTILATTLRHRDSTLENLLYRLSNYLEISFETLTSDYTISQDKHCDDVLTALEEHDIPTKGIYTDLLSTIFVKVLVFNDNFEKYIYLTDNKYIINDTEYHTLLEKEYSNVEPIYANPDLFRIETTYIPCEVLTLSVLDLLKVRVSREDLYSLVLAYKKILLLDIPTVHLERVKALNIPYMAYTDVIEDKLYISPDNLSTLLNKNTDDVKSPSVREVLYKYQKIFSENPFRAIVELKDRLNATYNKSDIEKINNELNTTLTFRNDFIRGVIVADNFDGLLELLNDI